MSAFPTTKPQQPLNVRELVLRVEALLRRAKIDSDKKIVVGSTVLDYDAL